MAIEKYNEFKHDLVPLDITMPNTNGLETQKAIRTTNSEANVVMCPAMGQENVEEFRHFIHNHVL